jgi:hypothetical protein
MTKEDFKFDAIIAIDPGGNGAISTWRANHQTMTVKNPKDIADLCNYLNYIKGLCNPIAFVEKVQAYHEDSKGMKGEKGYGKQFGIQKLLENFTGIKNALKIVNIPYILVFPMTWQTNLNLRIKKIETDTERKNRYKNAAQNYFKDIQVTLWNADSLLLIQFARTKIQLDFDWIIQNYPQESLNKTKLL